MTESWALGPYRVRPHIAVVLSGWPRVSETFGLNELLALHRRGMLGAVFATKAGDASLCQPGWEELDPLVEVLPEGSVAEQGAIVAKRVADLALDGVHGYFAHQPAAVAADAARRVGVPYGFSVHALDVRKVSAAELGERAAGAAVVIACNPDAGATVAATGTEPHLLSHGVDLQRFPVGPFRASTGSDGGVVEILAVGRLVEKKGFVHLLEALARLPLAARLRIVGDGPERVALSNTADRLGVGGRIEFVGRLTHHQLPELYASADIVAVPSVVDRNGDRDGLPNVVLESMASARAVVASDVAAVATAISTERTGLLVAPGDPAALAAALVRLGADPALRERLGRSARAVVEDRFDLGRCGDALCRLLEATYG